MAAALSPAIQNKLIFFFYCSKPDRSAFQDVAVSFAVRAPRNQTYRHVKKAVFIFFSMPIMSLTPAFFTLHKAVARRGCI
ncbi:hypothetical protein [Pseudodesulfovibrio profundus]|uniref:hypothetical protein n=1 Tax=Pseudodesulfovibrio profundus TaxID=57320 RepID=UPI0012FFBF34|nr:hypothetical protein [Pseudodesulfovibrio profundus]|tara:strand:- start:44 stop:283 length:240 start_codon:yes stop_codon:yes gene_type:complete